MMKNGRSPGFPEFTGLLARGSAQWQWRWVNHYPELIGMGLQLRGQLRYFTEFPFHPESLMQVREP
jgi:hypothetical protein